jgi:hypothetical protein
MKEGNNTSLHNVGYKQPQKQQQKQQRKQQQKQLIIY